MVWNYDEEKPDPWSTPLGLKKAFEKKGHIVIPFSIRPQNSNFLHLLEQAHIFDFIFICWCGPSESFDTGLEQLKKETKTKIFLELGDEPQTYNDNKKRILHVDEFFTPDLRCHKHYLERGLPSNWMTHWCDDEIFYKKFNVNKQNICVTTCKGYRPMLNELKIIYGDRFLNQEILDYDNTDYYNSGSITYQYARFDEITRRIFEAGGCGNAIITNRISAETGIYELFKDDEDIAYFSTVDECLYKMYKLFNDEEYRLKLSTNLYNKIIENHLIGNRIDQIIDVYNKQTIK